MAKLRDRLDTNVDGDFYVDSSCIDCATCRWMAPTTFDERGDYSRVFRQPESEEDVKRALMALVACPTASIGTTKKHPMGPVIRSFPDRIDEGVYHAGYHSESSFGAASYLLIREAGNVLVDSPRFSKPLVRQIEALGGVRLMFLTHRDDVADHAKWAAHFGCDRILHRADIGGSTQGIELPIETNDPVSLDDDLTVVPVPGHTRGSACLVANDRFLFSGDHVAWSEPLQRVYAFRRACWYDWATQIASMERLVDFRFEWILPGHGRRCHFPADQMSEELRRCVAWMREAA